jgi:hypothetical protein
MSQNNQNNQRQNGNQAKAVKPVYKIIDNISLSDKQNLEICISDMADTGFRLMHIVNNMGAALMVFEKVQ